jgi:hypothetical protein
MVASALWAATITDTAGVAESSSLSIPVQSYGGNEHAHKSA